ncbi:MAG: type II toxin-antitoxin system CcdA family antitoxin [Rhizobiaceae bacterium]|nr:type II toxin-antitoxin system CcdA family antitoxin [Rhizobiaceae bacterium]
MDRRKGAAIDAWNEWIAENGLPLAAHRKFG